MRGLERGHAVGRRDALLVGLVLLGATLLGAALGHAQGTGAGRLRPFGEAFWKHWGDGRAEISTYDLEFTRYGEPRHGTAVLIFVTETFSREARVKADPGRHSPKDEFPVLKLNVIQDFPTGIYDYNLMTSTFVALAPVNGRPPGSVVKISFSSQEWCGQVYHQLLPDENGVRQSFHSYFDGEADRGDTLPYPKGGVFEDALFCWARGLAAPSLARGEAREVPLLRSARHARLRHSLLEWSRGRLRRLPGTREATVPAGTFEVERFTAELHGGGLWTFDVEVREPRRIIRWERRETVGGSHGELVASERMKYWKMNAERFRESLARIGLRPRPERTP